VGNFLHVFGGSRVVKVVLTVILHALVIFVLGGGENDLNLTTEYQVEAITTGGLLKARDTRSLVPLIQFPTEGIGLRLDRTEFTSSNQPVSAGSMNVGDR
jgi:hypothetical protein